MCRQSAGTPTLCNALIINAVQAKSAECRQNQQIQSLGGEMQVKTLPQNASTRRYHKMLAQNANSNGGDASRVGKRCSNYLVEFVCLSFLCPTRDASPPLELAFELAFRVSVLC